MKAVPPAAKRDEPCLECKADAADYLKWLCKKRLGPQSPTTFSFFGPRRGPKAPYCPQTDKQNEPLPLLFICSSQDFSFPELTGRTIEARSANAPFFSTSSREEKGSNSQMKTSLFSVRNANKYNNKKRMRWDLSLPSRFNLGFGHHFFSLSLSVFIFPYR